MIIVKILYIIFAYLCGSVPFAYIIAKVFGKIDIRNFGSKNPGATNVFRMLGIGFGILTFILDALKGFVIVRFAALIESSSLYFLIVAVVVILGHVLSVFLKFKGGKGVSTGFGVLLAIMPFPSLIVFVIFCLVFLFSCYISLSSICAAISLPIISYFSGYKSVRFIIFSFIIVFIIIYKHTENIKRLINGSENRIKIK
jgi:glycerol-3-phosphate acyltransferase PlsY